MNHKKLRLTIPWEEIEASAQDQIKEVLKMDCLVTLAIMPDVHMGYDLPIGGVAVLDGHIWPGAVGYDIGCGMCHINTRTHVNDMPDLGMLHRRIMNMIPVGFNENPLQNQIPVFRNASHIAALKDAVRAKARSQMGTLGGGNHFIEIGVNARHQIGITIHSGSRRPGWLIADYYMQMSKGPIPIDGSLAGAYWEDMNWALKFALENRKRMMERCLQAMGLGVDHMENMINENHNHAEVIEKPSRSSHGLVGHRKGATPAESGKPGVIPANMRDGVWITVGLGNEEFLKSASHGAGRVMGRKQAERTLDPQEFETQMQGVVTPDLDKLLDEAPDAYKDIHKVLDAQRGVTIDIADHFRPLLVVKG